MTRCSCAFAPTLRAPLACACTAVLTPAAAVPASVPALCIQRRTWESGFLQDKCPRQACAGQEAALGASSLLPLAISAPQCEEPCSHLLSDHIFCSVADPATMKRPRSSPFCTQASTGYVQDGLAQMQPCLLAQTFSPRTGREGCCGG